MSLSLMNVIVRYYDKTKRCLEEKMEEHFIVLTKDSRKSFIAK